ncbi:type II toxin-antitoxin system RelE/ParE family toxin [Corynebacterium sp.]|uniref:type II toxin-antitoxin system RelE/ParE family toxin n=1 Tax=Corynebacterium sp. TaxID=1720 RepID=UPI0037BF9A04
MIRNFGDKNTERIWQENYVKSIDRKVQRATMRKLELIHAAQNIQDLRIPPRKSVGAAGRRRRW